MKKQLKRNHFFIIYRMIKSFIRTKVSLAIRKKHSILANNIKKRNGSINVIFLVSHSSIWKYEKLYQLLKSAPEFNPKVVVMPVVRKKDEVHWNNYERTLAYFKENEYDTLNTYDKENGVWIDIKTSTKPDLVFFTNPNKVSFDKYCIGEFKDRLTCYIPYTFVVITRLKYHYGQKFHQRLWYYFLETHYHEFFLESQNKKFPRNGFVSGYPGLDRIFDENYKPKNYWKKYSKNKTFKIIWAPHHTIEKYEGWLNFSNFLRYHEFFIELLKNEKNIQIAFKPHPILKELLYKDDVWGKEKTDTYYNSWNDLPNGQLEEGNYIDLFYLSDAMITDCASFIVEYLYFNKPLLFTMKDPNVKERFNSFGKEVFNYISTGNNFNDINDFIKNQVIENNDLMKIKRNKFLKTEILPKNGLTASENIFNKIKKELC